MTGTRSFKSILALAGCALAMFSLPGVSFAGGDDDDEGDGAVVRHHATGGAGGGGDSGSASVGVQAGFGGMSQDGGSSLLASIGLVGGGVAVLTAAGAVS